jgi:hypothetical protein
MPDRPPHSGDMAQIRLIAEQVADTALTKFVATHPEVEPKEPEIPAPLKWAAAIIASLMSLGIGALCLWLVTTLNEMQVTVARIDERQQSQGGDIDARFREVDRRVTRLEAYHASGRGGE